MKCHLSVRQHFMLRMEQSMRHMSPAAPFGAAGDFSDTRAGRLLYQKFD